MLVENVLIRSVGDGQVSISWISESEATWSWIFINGKCTVGPYMAETRSRNITLPVPTEKTFVVEIHDFADDTVPESIEQPPLIRPLISWNCLETAAAYHVYHTIFDTGSIESLVAEVMPLGLDQMEIDSPVVLEGRGGRWHSFRVETVDQFGNESQNEVVPYFALDLPPEPKLEISREVNTGTLTFRLVAQTVNGLEGLGARV